MEDSLNGNLSGGLETHQQSSSIGGVGALSNKELLHLSDLLFVAESARLAVNEALKVYKEKYGIDASILKSFATSKFGDQKKHQQNMEKHQQFVELDECFHSNGL